MMKIKYSTALCAALAVIGATAAMPAVAADDAQRFYVRGDLSYGWASPIGSSSDIVDGPGFGNDFGSSFGYGGGVGFYLPWKYGPASFRIDATIDDSPYLGGGNHTGTDGNGNAISAKVKLDTTTYLLNLYSDIDVGLPVTPFVGIGVGQAQNQVRNILFSNSAGTFGAVSPGNNTGAAWSATVGGTYGVTSALKVDLAYRYTYAGVAKSGGIFTELSTPTVSQGLDRPTSSGVSLNQLTLSVRYGF